MVEDVIVKVENCYFPVDFIIVDMKSTKDFIDSPIILWRLFLATMKAITDWGKGEVIFQVGDRTMNVSIDKLMRHPLLSLSLVMEISVGRRGSLPLFSLPYFFPSLLLSQPCISPLFLFFFFRSCCASRASVHSLYHIRTPRHCQESREKRGEIREERGEKRELRGIQCKFYFFSKV